MQRIEFNRERRYQFALERLESNSPVCLHCNEADWRCLERHPIGREAEYDTSLILCRNCHAKRSGVQPPSSANSRACVLCAEADPRCLEDHHIAGRKHDSTTVVTCFNCHRKLTDMQKDQPQ